ncbi:potassium channel family protein [Mycobacterium sp.]|uniref:potassium channel family protein n=1 Tax=Mycobacterium sp. TaxID=1785 RepID=UPI0031E41F3A
MVRVSRRERDLDETLTTKPGYALTAVLRIPEQNVSPIFAIWRRVAIALLGLLVAVMVVYVDRDGYTDIRHARLSFLDCAYYATVSLTTTGYGDVTPYTESARLVNIVIIMPLRVMFLIVLVGTTFQVLTERSRQAWKIQRWRSKVRNHTVVIGYGTKGKTATAAMIDDGAVTGAIVVVDTDQSALDHAAAADLVTVHGDATRSDVLRLASAQHASAIIVATGRDDTATLVTLTAREVAPNAKIVASIREAENQHLLKQSGADSVVVSSETAGRLLGVATTTPSVVEMIDDLLTPSHGFAIAEREVEPTELGGSPRHLPDIVLGVVRDGHLLRVDAPEADALEAGDRLLFVRNTRN